MKTSVLPLPAPAALAAALAWMAVLTPAPSGAAQPEPAPPAATPAAPAAPAAATFGGSLEVGLVGLEAWVTDRQGRPVTGLTADDFTVRHDGRAVPVTHFSEVRAGRVAPDREGPSPGLSAATGEAPDATPVADPPPGHLILYLDLDRLSPGSSQAVREAVDAVLASDALAAERILVLRQEDGLHLDVPLGSTAAAVGGAVDAAFADSNHRGLTYAAELERARESLMEVWEQSEQLSGTAAQGSNIAAQSAAAGPGSGSPGVGAGGPRAALEARRGSASAPGCDLFRQRAEPVLDAWTRDRSQRLAATLGNLDAAAGLLAGLPGVKSLVYVSDGLDMAPGASLAAYASDLCPGRGRERELEALAEGMTREFEALAAHLNSHGVTLHALQASGLGGRREGAASQRATAAPRRAAVGFETRQRQAERSGMEFLALQTGGRAVFNRGDLDGEVAAIGRDSGHYYSLAYAAPPTEQAGAVHRVELAVRDPALTVRHRRAVRAADPEERLAEGLAGALHLGLVANPHDLSLGLAEAAAGPLRLVVGVPLDRLLFAAGSGEAEAAARVELRGLALAAAGADGGAARPEPISLGQEFRLRQPEGASLEDLAGQRASLPLPLDLPPGPYRLAVALRDQGSGETSFVVTALSVPAADGGAAAPPPPD